MRAKDMSGMRFGKLLVISQSKSSLSGNAIWLCLCDCGKSKEVLGGSLRQGTSKSCGCVHFSHGRSGTTEYRSWCHMIERCENVKCADFKNYGGRGISVCARWRNSFENFLADMGEKPHPSLSIERKENNGNYEPTNCQWATATEQRRNKRNIKFSMEIAREIRSYHYQGVRTADIARFFKTSGTHISHVIKNASWKEA